MQRLRSSALESNINVTPLVDVCLVLLIIFMVVTPMIANGPVELPRTHSGDPADDRQHPIAITVKADGSVYIDTLVIRKEEVPSQMSALHARSPERPVSVRGDKHVPYGAVVDVLDACRTAGYQDVGLISRKSE